MELDRSHLELLGALAKHHTLAEASKAINLSASAASRRLHDAERRLGLPLAELDGRTLRLTSAGKLLADTAVSVTNQIAEAELAARWLSSGADAPIRVGVGFFDRVAWLLPTGDALSCEIVRSPSSRAEDVLDPRRVDLVVDVGASHDGITLLLDRLVLAVSPTHPLAAKTIITAADLASHRYFASDSNPLPGFEFDRFFVPGRHLPEVIMRIESFSAAIDFIARGDGVSIQPRQSIVNLASDEVTAIELDATIPVEWYVKPSKETAAASEAIQQIQATTHEF